MKRRRPGISIVLLGTLALLGGCATTNRGPADWTAWKTRRLESVAGTNGWTTLVGLHWLREGPNSAGSATTNDAVLPSGRAAGFIGNFIRHGEAVEFEAAPGAIALIDGKPVRTAALESDRIHSPTRLIVAPLSIVVIARGERIGLRVRDPEAPARTQFEGLRYFPYDPGWRLEGRFETFAQPQTLRVPSMIGGTEDFPSPGAVIFRYSGREYRLDVAVERDETDYFVMFRDQTAGSTTYGSGRFLYVSRPEADGRIVIDFNRAYTAPCGFTDFATCPLPPAQNRLPFPIPAGELKPSHPPLNGKVVASIVGTDRR